MPRDSVPPLDLDRLTRLAAEDPEAFERERRRLVDELIQGAPTEQQGRLRGLQWRVDTVREHAATPLAACLRISSMMWQRITEPGGLLDACAALERGKPPRQPGPDDKGRLLDFRPPGDDG